MSIFPKTRKAEEPEAPAPAPAPVSPPKPEIEIIPGDVATAGISFKERPTTSHIVVHCSATRPSQNLTARDIDKMHRARSYICIGYHFVIRRDGTIERGRPVNAVGAHAARGGFNSKSIGICLVGGVAEKPEGKRLRGTPWVGSNAEANFTPEQMSSLRKLIDFLRPRYGNPEVIGHRDIPGETKACPSFSVARWLDDGEVVL